MEYNIYCDESCHLLADHQPVMVLGAVWCPQEKASLLNSQIREIKTDFGLNEDFEIKWSKVSPGREDFYLELTNYFFAEDDLHFRGVVIPDKSKLRHDDFGQDHDTFYYKMYFNLLKVIIEPEDKYSIYLDIKDTRSREKVRLLKDVLAYEKYDFDRKIISKIQHVRSHEISLIQLTDLLIGAVMYINRGILTSDSKIRIVEKIKETTGYSLTRNTLLKEDKFNLLVWEATEKQIW